MRVRVCVGVNISCVIDSESICAAAAAEMRSDYCMHVFMNVDTDGRTHTHTHSHTLDAVLMDIRGGGGGGMDWW